jgi:hypothetical protein
LAGGKLAPVAGFYEEFSFDFFWHDFSRREARDHIVDVAWVLGWRQRDRSFLK